MKWKTIIGVTTTLGVLTAYLIVSTGFADSKQQELVCSELRITVGNNLVKNFIDTADVKHILTSEGIKTTGERICRINTYEIEQLLNSRSVIKNASAYTSVDGVLHIDVYQRRPIMRVQVAKGVFYIDEHGYIFPSPREQATDIPLMTGTVPMNIPVGFRGEIPNNETFLLQTYRLADYLDKSGFWLSQVKQLKVTNANNVRIIPYLGEHLIDMGSLDNFEYKFKKLRAFYSEVCHADDSTYKRIDLRYGNQIVCTKRK
ncbi:MAG: cell division protein FtsQ/DivIB [Bacteroidales bacterium]|nr:cell division protein FtsQ/DivIB [Bacteroidales bacterium]MCL2133235.1 cell division protein FtsQ/DivIB [Bacteroidales bacterium]